MIGRLIIIIIIIVLVSTIVTVNGVSRLRVYFDGGCKHLQGNMAGGGVVCYEMNDNLDDSNSSVISTCVEAFRCQYYYGKELHYNSHIIEYISLINAIQAVKYYCNNRNDIDDIQLLGDTSIVINHITKGYNRKKDYYLHQYHALAVILLQSVNTKYELMHISRENNTIADELANNAMQTLKSSSTLPLPLSSSSSSSSPSLFEGSLFIIQLSINPINEQFRSIYNTINPIISIGEITTSITIDDYDNTKVIDVMNTIDIPKFITINSSSVIIEIPIQQTLEKYDDHDESSYVTNIEIPVPIVTKHFGNVPSMSLSLLNIQFHQQDNILKAIISLISSSSSSLSVSSTYTFTSLIHSLQRRGLLSVLNKKLLVKVKDRTCWAINDSNNDDRDSVFWATPLQVSLLLGNMKTTQLLLSLGGIVVLYDKKNDNNNNNNYNNLSDEAAMNIGGNIKNMKIMNEFMKTIK